MWLCGCVVVWLCGCVVVWLWLWLLLLLLNGYNILKELLLLDRLTSSIFFVVFRRKNVCFVSRPMKIVTFLRKKRDPAKRVVDFPW